MFYDFLHALHVLVLLNTRNCLHIKFATMCIEVVYIAHAGVGDYWESAVIDGGYTADVGPERGSVFETYEIHTWGTVAETG